VITQRGSELGCLERSALRDPGWLTRGGGHI
jgi:hypothetical protein